MNSDDASAARPARAQALADIEAIEALTRREGGQLREVLAWLGSLGPTAPREAERLGGAVAGLLAPVRQHTGAAALYRPARGTLPVEVEVLGTKEPMANLEPALAAGWRRVEAPHPVSPERERETSRAATEE